MIAEYFLTCNPKGAPLPEGGTIPAGHVTETVQPDLVQNTLRESYKDRLAILINEFGTALAGNPQDLNEAIRLGSPALRKLQAALRILASENRTIRDLNANSDKIITQLANRRADVISFIQHARRHRGDLRITARRSVHRLQPARRLPGAAEAHAGQARHCRRPAGAAPEQPPARGPGPEHARAEAARIQQGDRPLAHQPRQGGDSGAPRPHTRQGRDPGAGEVGAATPTPPRTRSTSSCSTSTARSGRSRSISARRGAATNKSAAVLVDRPQGADRLHRPRGPAQLRLLPGRRPEPVRPVRPPAALQPLRRRRHALWPGLQRRRQPGGQRAATGKPRRRRPGQGGDRDDDPARGRERMRVVARRHPARDQPGHRLAAI